MTVRLRGGCPVDIPRTLAHTVTIRLPKVLNPWESLRMRPTTPRDDDPAATTPPSSPSDGRYVPSDAEREGIRSDIRALPPLSDQDIEDLAVIILDAREQRAAVA
jgi:hypothetical protein